MWVPRQGSRTAGPWRALTTADCCPHMGLCHTHWTGMCLYSLALWSFLLWFRCYRDICLEKLALLNFSEKENHPKEVLCDDHPLVLLGKVDLSPTRMASPHGCWKSSTWFFLSPTLSFSLHLNGYRMIWTYVTKRKDVAIFPDPSFTAISYEKQCFGRGSV